MVNLIFEIQFSDDFVLIARVWTNHGGLFTTSDWNIRLEIQSEIETIQYIADNSSIPVPTVVDFDLDPSGPLGYRYMITTAMDGQPLGKNWTEVPAKFQRNVLGQFADYLVQLSRLRFSAIGLLRYDGHTTSIVGFSEGEKPFTTTSQYIRSTREKLNIEVQQDTHYAFADDDKQVACSVLLKVATGLVQQETNSGPFPLMHHDLHYNNILVDDCFNITGIIDWNGASTAPQEVFASVHGFRVPIISDTGTRDNYDHCRQLFVEELKKREDDRSGGISVSDWVGSDSAQCLEFSLLDGYPWRAVPKAKYLVAMFPSITDGKNWEQWKEYVRINRIGD
jgi:isoamyl acetate esterase